jgi:WD40 repeat protein
MWSTALSPDGRRLAAAGADGVVRVTELPSGDATTNLSGHMGDVLALAWRPDGRWLASASVDGTVRLWPVSGMGDPIALRGPGKGVRTVAYSSAAAGSPAAARTARSSCGRRQGAANPCGSA